MARQINTAKEWKFPSEQAVDPAILEIAGDEILASLLIKRGLTTVEEARAFLDPQHYTPSAPEALPGMPQAVARVKQAIAKNEKITVYGDYDVDGVTATAVMVTTLRQLGADVDFYIPTRAEGYGLNLKAVSVLASKHRTKLIVSCDCGISNFSEINFARSLGVETIIVDHHSMPELLPPAVAILHPKQLDEEHKLFHLPGVGVAYKLAEALLIDAGRGDEVKNLLDYVTLGMIADMVPLVKECRYLVQVGMPVLVGSQRAGIQALLGQLTQKSEGTDLVGFGLAPRINAVGRLSDANAAVNLMITEDREEASKLAHQLELENARRQELCEQIFKQADQVAAQKLQSGDRALAIYDTRWHHGVVGIVASRLVEKYHCPVFIGEQSAEDGLVKGSARGIPGVDLYEVLKANEQLALKWGGHKMAAGFSVEAAKAEVFCQSIVQTCNRILAEKSMRPTLDIDLELPAEAVTMELTESLTRLAPFGMSNKKPVLAVRDGECMSTRMLGKEGKHHRVMVACGDEQFECVFWNSKGRVPDDGQKMDIAFSPELNTFNGNTRLQLVLADWRDPSQPAMNFAPPAVPDSVIAVPLEAKIEKPDSPEHRAEAQPAQQLATARTLSWKDLRGHSDPATLIPAAVRKLGDALNIFAEGVKPVDESASRDRTSIESCQHLMLWSVPTNLPLFKQILTKSGAQTIYLVGAAPEQPDDTQTFLRKLLGLVRFAVNQRDGQAEAEKLASALATSKMCIALGLTIFKKSGMVDWFSEDGNIFLEVLGQPEVRLEEIAEYKQLAQCLREIADFRNWFATASLHEIQLAVAPGGQQVGEQQFGGIQHHDTANQLSSTYTG